MMTRFTYPLLAVATSVLAQICLQRSAKSGGHFHGLVLWMAAAVGCYGLSMLTYWKTLQSFPISRIGPAVTSAVVVCIFVYGVACEGEGLSPKQGLGLLLAVGSIFLLVR